MAGRLAMTTKEGEPSFPLTVIFANGEKQSVENINDAECNLEWLDTEDRDEPVIVVEAAQYGGKPADWAKVRSSSYRAADGTKFRTHWYQNVKTGQRIEYKTKLKD
jgi:hypothetical protein